MIFVILTQLSISCAKPLKLNPDMKIELKRLNDAVHFELKNENGNTVLYDGSPDIGGEGKGVRPMQSVIMGLAACSAIDVVIILKKMRQPLNDLQVTTEVETAKDGPVTTFRNIVMHYRVWGDLKEEKVRKAIEMSIETYCSVGKIIEKTSPISYTLSLNPSPYIEEEE